MKPISTMTYRCRLALLCAVLALLPCCVVAEENDASTSSSLVTCNPGETLVSATCPSSGPCIVRNAELRSATPSSNQSTQTAMNVGVLGADRDALLGFDLSAIPAGATVTKGVLTLTTGPLATNLSPGNTSVAQNTGPWTEATVTWATAPTPSLTLGLQGNTTTVNAPWSINLPTSLVQGWVGPGATNDGVRLTGSGGTAKQNFITSKNTTVASRPRLDVCYVPAPAPTPCTNGVLDGTESDVDCGGSCPTKCADTAACNTSSDCAHNLCITGICEPLGGQSIAVVQDCTLPAPAGVTPVVVQYGTDAAQVLTLYIPTGTPPAEGWKVVEDWHPGGGNMGMMSDLASHCQVLAAQGTACVTIGYRFFSGTGASSVNGFPAAVNDGRCATRWLRTYGVDDYGLDTAHITAACYSFGCAIAGKVATEAGITDPGGGYTYDADATCPLAFSASDAHPFVGVADFYGNTDFRTPSEWSAYSTNGLAYLGVNSTSDATWASRAAAASVTWSWGDPELLVSGDPADTVVAHAQLTRLCSQAQANGVACTLVDQNFGHGEPPIYWGRVPSGCTPPACTKDAHPATCSLAAFLTQ